MNAKLQHTSVRADKQKSTKPSCLQEFHPTQRQYTCTEMYYIVQYVLHHGFKMQSECWRSSAEKLIHREIQTILDYVVHKHYFQYNNETRKWYAVRVREEAIYCIVYHHKNVTGSCKASTFTFYIFQIH